MEEKPKKDILRLPSITGDRSFLTETKVKEGSVQERINEYNSQIKQQVAVLSQELDSVLQRNEQDYLNAFGSKMRSLMRELQDLKKSANNTDLSMKHKEEMRKLQQDLEVTKSEAISLGNLTEKYRLEIEKLREKNQELESDCIFFETRFKSEKRKLFTKSVEKKIEPVLITALETTPVKLDNLKYSGSSKSGKVIEDLLSRYSCTDPFLYKELENILENRNKAFERSARYYKSLISKQKNELKAFSVMHSSVFSEKSELENLFLDCVEEVKKDISHKQIISTKADKYPLKSKVRAEANDMFNPSDKQKIMELLISNEQVLIMLYEKLFPFRASQYGNPVTKETVLETPEQDLETFQDPQNSSLLN